MHGLLHSDEPEPHRLCFAKKAAAFFSISRSSWSPGFLPQAGELFALGGRQPGLPWSDRAGVLDPVAQRGLRQPEVAGRGGDGLPHIQRTALAELVGETRRDR